ncbi:phosphoenolpyruvate synthase [Desulfofalx alkaliphila]|uniref:phosphoenolpyruvate synthase n=1 Tax=Desulfofalx alkaliphila TaxID=105483 RepID=UPI0004E17FFF|nr:phosphoenolpyruvate synthase [Desulfofalx alkaliphila]
MDKYVLSFNEIDKRSLPYVGGKGANLGELIKAGFPVPQGFCVTTLAYRAFIQQSTEINRLFDQLDHIKPDDLDQTRKLGQSIREHLQSMSMPDDIKVCILEAFHANGKDKAYAVRSSATAEDLPSASFAGQQDTYLNIRGPEQLIKAIKKCWISLFTDRAITYRTKNNFDHRSVFLSVVVQEMVFPEVAGIMFTADPITGRRKTVSINAGFGLGEALVSGLVTADLYQVRSQKIIKKQISKKKIAIYSLPEGGTVTKDLPPEKQEQPVLEDGRIIELAELGQKIEKHYGLEQDIEWAYAESNFYILQSRPITSLFPAPQVTDGKFHVFVSFGHIQVMTDAMKPLSISLISNLSNGFKKDFSESFFIYSAGGRVFADFTGPLLFKPSRHMLFKLFKKMDELLVSALGEAVKNEEFVKLSLSKKSLFRTFRKLAPIVIPTLLKVQSNLHFKNPNKAKATADLMIKMIAKENEAYIFKVSGAERIRRIRQSMGKMPKALLSVASFWIAGVLASASLTKKLTNQVGERESSYLLGQLNKSLPGNVTTELGLELGDLADTARKYPEVIDYLEKANNSGFYEELLKVDGGLEFKQELDNFLKKYGMRCTGEIDITKPRWNEDPTQLIPSILSNIRTTSPKEHREKFNQGIIEAGQAEKDILSKFGFFKRKRISRLIKLYRNLMGMREHHKFALITHMDIYKRAILEEAQTLKEKGILPHKEDVFYLTLDELIALNENRYSGNIQEVIEERKKQYELNQKLTVPRVITSEGEIITGKGRNVKAPDKALIGTPVSSGVVEGVARVILRLEDAKLRPGEILVTSFTDPGWTPIFTSAVGLVTEVGGMMSHGSVIAREYGIPAVAGIENATNIIKDGSYIRINGTEGYVQILD